MRPCRSSDLKRGPETGDLRAGLLLITSALSIGACSPPTWTHKAALIEADVALACDFGQTAWLADGGRWDRPGGPGYANYEEENPLLGRHPSVLEVGGYLGVIAVAATAAYPALPPWARSALYFTIAGLETANVVTNNHHGVCGL